MSKKLIALVLAVTFAFSFIAKGATVEELQAQIAALLAQIQALQAQLGQQTTTTGGYCFNTDLKLGMTSSDVKNLQIVLKVTPTSGYFGPLTLAAVKKFQAENGIPQTGYVGPLTRTALNSKFCAPPTTVPPTTAPTTPTTSVAPSYGSLSVQSYPVSNPQTTLYGGQTYEVLAGQFKATGSDITVKKVGIKVTSATNNVFPWQVFSTISVWDGSTKLAELPVTSANAIQNDFAHIYTFNIAGLNWVVPNGQNKVLTVKVTVNNNLSADVIGKQFTFQMFKEGVVYTDTAGVTYTSVDHDVASQTLTIATAQKATITLTVAADNPYDTNVIGSTTGTTRVDLLKFNLKTDDVNATLNSASGLVVTIGTTSIQSYITSIELWDGSTLVQSAAPTWTDGNVTTGDVAWSNFTLPVSAGTTKTLTVKAQIAQLPTSYIGSSVKYIQVTTGPTFSGMDANSNVVNSTGTVSGNKAYLFVKAPTFAFSGATFTASGDQTNPQSVGNSKITFTVTANGDDIYIDPTSSNTFATTSPVVSGPNTVANGFTCTSNATQDANGWRITSGSTATCELNTTIQLSTTTAGAYYQVQVKQVTWKVGASGTPINQTWGWDNFKTGLTYLAHN